MTYTWLPGRAGTFALAARPQDARRKTGPIASLTFPIEKVQLSYDKESRNI